VAAIHNISYHHVESFLHSKLSEIKESKLKEKELFRNNCAVKDETQHH